MTLDPRRRGRCPGCGGPLLALVGTSTRCGCGVSVGASRSGRLWIATPRGLGDRLANLLSWWGVTRATWSYRPRVCGAFMGVWMRPPVDSPVECHCGGRQRALNDWCPW